MAASKNKNKSDRVDDEELHQSPVNVGRDALGLHLQITSIRRAPGKLKYLAGSESAMQAFIMDMKPEQSAAQLRDVKI